MQTKNSVYRQLLHTDRWLLFAFIALSTFMLLLIKKSFIESEIAAFEILESQGRNQTFHLTNFIQYVSIPLIYLWKFTLIGFVLWVGGFMFGQKISYSSCWQSAMVAETIFFAAELMKIAWFFTVETDPTIWQVQAFYPLSLIHFFDTETLSSRFLYPLKAINILEFIYIFLLAKGLKELNPKAKGNTRHIVWASYGICFILWLGFYLLVYK